MKNESGITFDDFRTLQAYDIAYLMGTGDRVCQQDAGYIAANDTDIMAVLCDGMGYSEYGGAASRSAVEAFKSCYYFHAERDVGFTGDWLKGAAEEIDDIIYQLRTSEGKKMGAGTTIAALLIHNHDLYWLSVGDSRIYFIRKNEIVRATTDHNYYFELERKLREGFIGRKDFEREKAQGEALISFLGMGGLTMMDVNREAFQVQRGDIVLMCSDGLYRAVEEREILEIMQSSGSMGEASSRLEERLQAKSIMDQDNYTAFLIRRNEKW